MTSSTVKELTRTAAKFLPPSELVNFPQGRVRLAVVQAEFPRVPERGFGRPDQPEGLLTEAKLQPQDTLAGVQLQRLLQQFHRKGKFFIKIMNSRGQPTHEPIARCQRQRPFKTVIRPFLLARQLYISPRQPNVWAFPTLLQRSVRVSQRRFQIAKPRESDRLRRQQFRFVGKSLERLVRPLLRFLKFVQLDKHPHLPGPGGGVGGI